MKHARVAVLLMFGFAACRDAQTGPAPVVNGVSAKVVPCEGLPGTDPACGDPGAPVGGNINTSDSYVVANTSQTFTTTVTDSATGAATVLPSQAMTYRVEVGYSPMTGRDVYQHVYPASSSVDSTVRVTRVEGNVASEIGPNGLTAARTSSDQRGSIANPLNGMPDLGMFPSIIDAIVSGSVGAFRVGQVAEQLAGANASVAQLSSGVSARLVGNNELVLSIRNKRDASAEATFSQSKSGDWILHDVSQVTEASGDRHHVRMESHIKFKGIRYQRNVDGDRVRDQKRAGRFSELQDATALAPRAPRAAPGINLLIADGSWSSTGIVGWNPPSPLPFPITPPSSPPVTPDPNGDTTAEQATGCVDGTFAAAQTVAAGSGRRLAFQHGFASGACTWSYQLPFFAADAAGGRVVGNTWWPGTYESQAAQLKSQIPTGSTGWVLVGHSNGGIVSRYLAQTQPGIAKAVITINSPHLGADLAASSGDFLRGTQFLAQVGAAIWSAHSMGATSMGMLYGSTSMLNQILRGDAVVLPEMKPGSGFLTDLNTRAETGYKRYAIRSQVSTDWMSVRVFCDNKPASSPGVPFGRACVGDVKRLISRATFNGAILGFLSLVARSLPFGGLLTQSLQYASRSFFALTGLMYAVDWKWSETFCGNQPCDGVVRMTSQVYPRADAERVIQNADSHVGSTKSLLVTLKLQELVTLANR